MPRISRTISLDDTGTAPRLIAIARFDSQTSKCSPGAPPFWSHFASTPISAAMARSSSCESATMWDISIRPNGSLAWST